MLLIDILYIMGDGGWGLFLFFVNWGRYFLIHDIGGGAQGTREG
jgi:hypothetical protein